MMVFFTISVNSELLMSSNVEKALCRKSISTSDMSKMASGLFRVSKYVFGYGKHSGGGGAPIFEIRPCNYG